MGGLECGSPHGCVRNTPSDVEDLTGHQLRAGRRPGSGEECTDPCKTREGEGRREEEETEQDQTCTPDSRWGCGAEAGVGSPVGVTARDSGQSEAAGERSGPPVTG